MSIGQRAREAVAQLAGDERFEQFRIDPRDFLAARERGESPGTRIDQRPAALTDAAEIVNRSFAEHETSGRFTNVISPVVIPNRRSAFWLIPVVLLALLGLSGSAAAVLLGAPSGVGGVALALFGPHFWLLALAAVAFGWWRQGLVMVPDGCQALITRFGRLEQIAGPGRTLLFNPWKQVSYIVNTTREYPYNAPIREAPTASRVTASVDLFLQFRIEDPAEFIFTLGGVKGFSDKLQNAISEVTRALIYEQRAEAIYDLVGESTQGVLGSLNDQFLPAVRFTNANITHAEPSSQEYRIDLAAPEMVRVAKEAYTYQYELQLRKEQNEGELNKALATLRETLSAIRAEIATYQAQMDTAREREMNRANAYARQRLVEAESAANANAALLEAQALDIRAVSTAAAPEILEYRFQQEVLERLEGVGGRLPQVIQLGGGSQPIDFLGIARELIGTGHDGLYTPADMAAIRERQGAIEARIEERAARIARLTAEERAAGQAPTPPAATGAADEGQVAAIRQSVTDERIQGRVERISQAGPAAPDGGGLEPPANGAGARRDEEGRR